ncbi:MAG: SDR family oxidoreductase [Anaerolineales bacterium]
MNINLKSKYGAYALITGAASGIGRAFAERLAQLGVCPILLDVNAQGAQAEAQRLREVYRVDARPLAVDLSAPDFMREVQAAIAGLDVGLLVHAAVLSFIGEFLESPVERHRKLIDINIRASMELARYFGEAFKNQKRGGLVLFSSASALQGSALVQHYAASKAYLLILAEGLWYELRPHGVDVLAVMPGSTDTPAIYEGSPDLRKAYIMQPVEVVDESLAALGRQPSVLCGAKNRLSFFFLTRILPRKLGVQIVSDRLMSMYRK